MKKLLVLFLIPATVFCGQLTNTTVEVQTILDEQNLGNQAVNVGWDDLANSLIGRRLSSTSGKVDYNWDENTITFASGGSIGTANDRVNFNLQKPHGMLEAGHFMLHTHWEQVSTNTVEFTVQYRIQTNNAAKATSWTEVTANSTDDSVFTYTSGTLNQITELADIDLTGSGISATVQFRMARTDSTSGDIEVAFVDVHFPTDQERGSREEYVK